MHYKEPSEQKPEAPARAETDDDAAERALADLRRSRTQLAHAWERSSRLLRRAAELDRRAAAGGDGTAEDEPARPNPPGEFEKK